MIGIGLRGGRDVRVRVDKRLLATDWENKLNLKGGGEMNGIPCNSHGGGRGKNKFSLSC